MKLNDSSYATIDLIGLCNLKCSFCYNRYGQTERSEYHTMHFKKFIKFFKFVELLEKYKINEVRISGSSTDPLLYKYINELVDYFLNSEYKVGMNTNAREVTKHIDLINKLTGGISYSCPSLTKTGYYKITEVNSLPNWDIILNLTPKCRIAIVANKNNMIEILDMIKFFIKFESVDHVQICREYHFDDKYKSVRCIPNYKNGDDPYLHLLNYFEHTYYEKPEYFGVRVFDMNRKEIHFWDSAKRNMRSIWYSPHGKILLSPSLQKNHE